VGTMALAQPDRRVLQAARGGDEGAFQTLVESYREPVLGYIRRLVRDPCLAEDLTQEVFLRVYQRLPSFSERCLFTTWLFQVTKNRVIDELRAARRRPQPELLLEAVSALEDRRDHGQHNETVEAIWQAVAELDLSLKMALLLRDVVGLSYREIADVLESELGTVKWRIHRARENVQQALHQRGLGIHHNAASTPLQPALPGPSAQPA
jgi:RNA polymerase sigma-70 factor, ECF subfamily